MTERPSLAPPDEHKDKRWHWIEFPFGQGAQPQEWDEDQWNHAGMKVSPDHAAGARWKYIGPCLPARELPEQCETVAKLLKDAANQIRRVETERDAAQESHAMQQRNTAAFFRENATLRAALAATQARVATLERALATCDGALERIDAEAQRCRRIQGGPAVPETDAGKSYGYGKIVIEAREARAAAMAAL